MSWEDIVKYTDNDGFDVLYKIKSSRYGFNNITIEDIGTLLKRLDSEGSGKFPLTVVANERSIVMNNLRDGLGKIERSLYIIADRLRSEE